MLLPLKGILGARQTRTTLAGEEEVLSMQPFTIYFVWAWGMRFTPEVSENPSKLIKLFYLPATLVTLRKILRINMKLNDNVVTSS